MTDQPEESPPDLARATEVRPASPAGRTSHWRLPIDPAVISAIAMVATVAVGAIGIGVAVTFNNRLIEIENRQLAEPVFSVSLDAAPDVELARQGTHSVRFFEVDDSYGIASLQANPSMVTRISISNIGEIRSAGTVVAVTVAQPFALGRAAAAVIDNEGPSWLRASQRRFDHDDYDFRQLATTFLNPVGPKMTVGLYLWIVYDKNARRQTMPNAVSVPDALAVEVFSTEMKRGVFQERHELQF